MSGRYTSVAMNRRAFSLVELLTVMIIIALVISILVPALGRVRNVSRNTSSQALLTSASQACAQFTVDKQRQPGYFSPREMGSLDNATRGLTAMENVMLDLGGGIVGTGANRPANAPNAVAISPVNDTRRQVWVDVDEFTSSGKSYFKVPATSMLRDVGQVASEASHRDLPDLVDAFGVPMLAWAVDAGASDPIDAFDDFAKVSSAAQARIYWNSNAGFLSATAMGKNKNKNQATKSLIGEDNTSNIPTNLAGYLGSPANPVDSSRGTNPNNARDWLPATARGSLMFQYAGEDGIFLSKDDKGAKLSTNANTLYYGLTKTVLAGEDLASRFDDILVNAGS
ncbi:MAG: type II secretion system protein [Planctomycetota bacterium]|nr:type II secretion system protein [Planctomycetota bacterium]